MARRAGHYLKYGLAASFLAGTVGGTLLSLKGNEWNISSVGAVRFGRAAWAACRVVIDYKRTLRSLDPDSDLYVKLKSQVHRRSAERLRDMCFVNGGCFIKVGQHLSALEYLIPLEYVQVLQVCHSNAPESKLEDVHAVIKEDLGMEVDEIFTSFDTKPIGTASLAQVHRATLKDGSTVAVKVQHRRVLNHSFVDMKTMEVLVKVVAKLFPEFQFLWLAEETKKNLPKELDFLHEGKNCERVAKMFDHFDFLRVPKVHWKLCSKRVLTMEYCEGGQVNDKAYMTKHNVSVEEVSRKLGQLYSEMIFVQGYVHCDPHPGNVLVNKTKHGVELVLLDHGLYQSLTDSFRLNYCNLWMSLIKSDMDGLKRNAELMGCGDLFGLFACVISGRSWKAIQTGIDKQKYTQEEDDEIKANAALYLPQISEILNRVPREMLLIMKTNDLLRGIEFNLKTQAQASSFITMSKCCVRAVAHHELKHCDGILCRVRIRISEKVSLFKLNLYECYLWLIKTTIVQVLLGRFLAI